MKILGKSFKTDVISFIIMIEMNGPLLFLVLASFGLVVNLAVISYLHLVMNDWWFFHFLTLWHLLSIKLHLHLIFLISGRGRTRRSTSREKDYLSLGRSEESHNEKNGIRNATHQQHDEEQMKFNDKKEKKNLKNRHRSHRRTPRDEDGHRLSVDTDEERWHGNARKSSRDQNDSVSPDKNGDIKRTRYSVECDGSKSDMDEDEDKEAHRAHSKRHNKRHKTMKHEDRSERTHNTDFPLHRSSRDGHDGYSKHGSSKHNKRSRSSHNDSMSYDMRDRWDPEK